MKQNKGYTLLFAVLVAAVALSVGVSILTISKKELQITTSSRESMQSIYIADSAIECANYWDKQPGNLFLSPGSITIYCGVAPSGSSAGIVATTDVSGGVATTNFAARFTEDNGNGIGSASGCATVKITKAQVAPGPTAPYQTDIVARGYNIGWDSATKACTAVSPKKVERALYFSKNS